MFEVPGKLTGFSLHFHKRFIHGVINYSYAFHTIHFFKIDIQSGMDNEHKKPEGLILL
jgi:hypothetical protein